MADLSEAVSTAGPLFSLLSADPSISRPAIHHSDGVFQPAAESCIF